MALMWFETAVGSSFKCNLTQAEDVTNSTTGNGLSVNFAMSQWEAFKINESGEYSKGR